MKNKHASSAILKAPRISFQEIGQTIYVRILFQGKETKFSTNIINVKGEKLDTKTGMIKGDSEATKLLIAYRDRMTSFYEKALESNKRIDLQSIKIATLGSSATAKIPNLFEAIDKWFEYKYHNGSGLNRWTIEKNGYIVDNIKSFLKKEYKDYLIPLDEVELIIADKLINYLKNERGNQYDHAVRQAKALKSVLLLL